VCFWFVCVFFFGCFRDTGLLLFFFVCLLSFFHSLNSKCSFVLVLFVCFLFV